MRFIYILLTICLFFPISVLAEGPPIDSDGNITVQYKAIELTVNQKNQLKFSRILNLSGKQLKYIGSKHFPADVYVIDPHYNDCSCGNPISVIWFHVDSIAVLYDDINWCNIHKEYNIITQDDSLFASNEMFLANNTLFYYKGKVLMPSQLFRIALSNNTENKYFFMHAPPFKDNKVKVQLKNRLGNFIKMTQPFMKIVLM